MRFFFFVCSKCPSLFRKKIKIFFGFIKRTGHNDVNQKVNINKKKKKKRIFIYIKKITDFSFGKMTLKRHSQ